MKRSILDNMLLLYYSTRRNLIETIFISSSLSPWARFRHSFIIILHFH